MIGIVKDIIQVILLHMRTADGGRETRSRIRLRDALDTLDDALNDMTKNDESNTHASK